MTATGTFGVIGMDGAVAKGGDGIFDKSRFVQCVGMNGNLNVIGVGNTQTTVDGSRG